MSVWRSEMAEVAACALVQASCESPRNPFLFIGIGSMRKLRVRLLQKPGTHGDFSSRSSHEIMHGDSPAAHPGGSSQRDRVRSKNRLSWLSDLARNRPSCWQSQSSPESRCWASNGRLPCVLSPFEACECSLIATSVRRVRESV